jgi:hypothetical protein
MNNAALVKVVVYASSKHVMYWSEGRERLSAFVMGRERVSAFVRGEKEGVRL